VTKTASEVDSLPAGSGLEKEREDQEVTQACSVGLGGVLLQGGEFGDRASSTEKCFWLRIQFPQASYGFPLWSSYLRGTVREIRS
jgi:hypothetical protein